MIDLTYISHNAPFRTEMCTFLFWMVHCGIWKKCIMGFMIFGILALYTTSVFNNTCAIKYKSEIWLAGLCLFLYSTPWIHIRLCAVSYQYLSLARLYVNTRLTWYSRQGSNTQSDIMQPVSPLWKGSFISWFGSGFNTLRLKQNGPHFAEDIFKWSTLRKSWDTSQG